MGQYEFPKYDIKPTQDQTLDVQKRNDHSLLRIKKQQNTITGKIAGYNFYPLSVQPDRPDPGFYPFFWLPGRYPHCASFAQLIDQTITRRYQGRKYFKGRSQSEKNENVFHFFRCPGDLLDDRDFLFGQAIANQFLKLMPGLAAGAFLF